MSSDANSSATAPRPGNRPAMFTVFMVVFIDLLGFGIVLPLLPRYSELYLGGYSDDMAGLILGFLYSSFSLMQFVFTPIWGRLSDRIGRKPVLLLSLVGSVLFYGLFGYASLFPKEQATLALILLLISRVGAGIAGASVSTAAAVIADCTTPEKRSKGMALIGAAFGIGFTFGPLMAYAGLQFLDSAKYAPGAVASGLSFLALILAIVKFKETRDFSEPAPKRNLFSMNRTVEVLKMPVVGVVVLISFLGVMGFANFEATLSLFTKDTFQLNDEDNFLVFAYIGMVLMVAQGGLYRRFAGRTPDTRLMLFGIGMMLLGMGGLGGVAYTSSLLQQLDSTTGLKTMFYLSLAVAVTGFAFLNPSVSAIVSKHAPKNRQGEVQGVAQSFGALARIVGPMIGLYVYQQHSSRVLPYVVAAVAIFLVLFLMPAVIRGEQPEPKTEPQEAT